MITFIQRNLLSPVHYDFMLRVFYTMFSLLLFISPAFPQGPDSALYLKYKLDKSRFQAFESQHRGRLQRNGHTVSYLKWGDSRDSVFIWLPGSLLSAYDFYPFAESLVHAGYCVLSVDHYGHGLTPIPDQDLDFWDFADDLAAIMDDLGLKDAVVGGFSRGGYMATAFYDRHPKRVKALVLEDGGTVAFKSLFTQMEAAELRTFFHSVEPPPEVQELLFARYKSEFEIYKNIDQLDGSTMQWQIFGFIKQQQDSYLLYHGLNEYMNMQDSLHYAQVLNMTSKVSHYASSMTRVEPLQTYRSLQVPMLIIDAVGKNDIFNARSGNQELKAMHPDLVRHQLFDCADHNIHFACPEQFSKALTFFLTEL